MKKLMRENSYLWVGLLFSAGLLFFIFGSFAEDAGRDVLNNILTGIAGSFMVGATLGLIEKISTRNQLLELILDKVSLKRNIDSLGIVDVYSGWDEIPYKSLIKKASKEIDIVHTYGRTWNRKNTNYLVKALEAGVKIRIVLLDPNEEELINVFARHFSKEPQELRYLIEESLKNYKSAYERSGINKKENFKIYLQKGIQTMALYRFDDTIVNTSLSLVQGPKFSYTLPSIVYRKTNGAESGLYEVYLNEINEVAEQAKLIDLNSI